MIDLIPPDDQSHDKGGKLPRIRILFSLGILVTLLFFNFAVVSANNTTDLNVTLPNSTLAEPPVVANITQNVTSVPTILVPSNTLIPNTTLIPFTTLITPVPAVIPNVTQNVTPMATTLVTSIPTVITNTTLQTTIVPNTTLITAVQAAATTANPTQNIPTMSARDAIEQYTLRAENSITQEDKEQAAARYRKIREAYLLQTDTATQGTGGYQVAGYSINAVSPTLDPGGVPHYFGPFPNWANSPMPKGVIANITVDNGGTGYSANPTVSVTDVYFTGSGATATATVIGGAITGITVTNPGYGYSAPVIVITDVSGSGAAATAILGGPFTGGIRKFVDSVPLLNAAGANNLGQYIPVAIPDTASYPGSDYYEIELGEYREKLHSDLPPTTLRGYRQTNTIDPTVSQFHNLGPLIVSQTDRPVRIKFTNNLPVGAEGNLFIPVDQTVMGANMGPQGMNVTPSYYTENRAEIHLHGGATPWISDGTPHQWITPAGEYTPYPKGASVYNVPDMPDPGNGSVTLFYTNQQSARLMFYHDHSHGITRLNVYAGEAGAYLLRDRVEQDMIDGTNTMRVNPTNLHVLPDTGIPLVIQDKTFVDNTTIAAQDPTWNWGSDPGNPMTGDLWFPHVYMTAQNPYDDTGVNPYGRWHYGPWFFPPAPAIIGPTANPYFGQPGEPPMIPGTPNPSMATEAFMDTPLVNGAVYPNMTVEPRAYRFRILNAADDRFFNLQLYVADANVTTADGRNNTEVKMVPAVLTPGFPADWPTDGREGGVPDPATMGPSFIYIGTEGGFLPAPVVVPNQPITWVRDPTVFNNGNVDLHALLIAPAERADVIVDFTPYAGQTLILYNDGPAAFPARVPQYDYYTGAPDLTSSGGAPAIQPGYGPNTRTVMQIKVGTTVTTPTPDVTLANLESVFAKTATKRGVFEVSQPPVIISQPAYNSAYNATFTQNNFIRIFDQFANFTTISGIPMSIPLTSKAIQDEQGEAFDQYGRAGGFLGLQTITAPGRNTLLLYGYNSPPTDVLNISMVAMSEPQPGDGTQIWKITHNGVDSHPVHWHLYNVQVINRVGWDGFIRPPHATELGWKETLRISPLEDTIVALRPVAPTLPFAEPLPDSVRPIDPAMPLGAELPGFPGGLGWSDPAANPITVPNHLVNLGWEYVWHCHILAHEEMDMMHSQAVSVNQPGNTPTGLISGEVNNTATNTIAVYLAWQDNSNYETDWIILRSNITEANWTELKRVPSYTTPEFGANVWAMAIDNSIPANTPANYTYKVQAANIVGDDYVYPGSSGFPTIIRKSPESAINQTQANTPPVASFNLNPATGFAPLNVSFTDTSTGGPTGWIWDFGDGNYASDNGKQNPNHVYELPGNYTVTLTAMNTGGSNMSPVSGTVNVSAQPLPPVPIIFDFTNSTTTTLEGFAPHTVTFNVTALSEPAVWATWRWNFGDGTFSSVKNATHTYTVANNYTVTLTATNLGGTTFMTKVGYVNVTTVEPSRIGVYQNGIWYLDYNGNGTWDGSVNDKAYIFGGPGNVSIVGDWNGDRITEIGVTNSVNWSLDYNGNGTWDGPLVDRAPYFGIVGYTPVVGDWNGDGKTKVAVYNSGTWYLDSNGDGIYNAGIDKAYSFGGPGNVSVVGDWNGDGITEIGVTNSVNWYLDYNGNGTYDGPVIDRALYFGIAGYKPVVGDWNRDGKTEVGVTNSVNWYLDYNGNGTWDGPVIDRAPYFGISGYRPVVGDWNRDGKTEVGVTDSVYWYLDYDGNGTWDGPVIDRAPYFGIYGFTPVVGKW